MVIHFYSALVNESVKCVLIMNLEMEETLLMVFFFFPMYCFAELTALLIPLLNWSYFGNTHIYHTKLYDILVYKENSTVYCNAKTAWLQ